MKYELTIITLGDKNTKEAATIVADVKTVLTDQGATGTTTKDWGRRELAYPIAKQIQGYYTTFEFEMDGTKISAMERQLGLNKDIARFLTVNAYQRPTSLVEEKEEDETARSAEESLRRSSTKTTTKKKAAPKAKKINEGEREQKVDEALSKILEEEK